MSYARIGIWSVDAGAGADRAELTRLLRDELIPTYQRQSGFIDYLAIAVGENEFVGVQVWDTPEQATAVGAQTGDKILEQIGGRARLTSWYHGPVVIEIADNAGEQPAYGRVGIWDIAPDLDQHELIERAREGLMPLYQQQAALVSYRAVLSVEGRLVVVHTWKAEADARQGMQATGAWLQETLANQLALIAGYDGEVVSHAAGNGSG